MNQPLHPQQLYQQLLHLHHQESLEQTPKTTNIKQTLLQEIQSLQQIKNTLFDLISNKTSLTKTLQELLNYRKSIDHDQKYQLLQYDHYSFPYRNIKIIQQQLFRSRQQNLDKRRQIHKLQLELKQKHEVWQAKKDKQKRLGIQQIKHTPSIIQRVKSQQDLSWVSRIQNVKRKYLNEQKQFKRAKIKHDYNLLVDRHNCKCVGKRSCEICSGLNTQTAYKKAQNQALYQRRYKQN